MEPRALRLAALAALAFAGSCARENYDVADLQVDVTAPLPSGTETMRMCVSDHGEKSQGAGNGRMAFPGLRAGEPVEVSLDLYDADGVLIGSIGATAVDLDAPWAQTPLLPASAPCVSGGAIAAAGTETSLLALRFEE